MSADNIHGLVLVVEDEKAIADLERMYLTKAGFGVETVADGDSALSKIAELKPAAVVLDIGIPGPDGIEICRRLRAEGNWTPVLFCTARDEEIDRVLGLEMGGDDYIAKPFSPRELAARVRVALRRQADTAKPEPTAVYRGTHLMADFDAVAVSVDGAAKPVAETLKKVPLFAMLNGMPTVDPVTFTTTGSEAAPLANFTEVVDALSVGDALGIWRTRAFCESAM